MFKSISGMLLTASTWAAVMVGTLANSASAVVPGAPALVTPAADAVLQAVSFTAAWTAPAVTGTAGAAASYQIQISTLEDFSVLAVDESGITDLYRAVGPLKNSTLYHWRVRARNADGPGEYAAARAFTTIVATPVAVTLVAPANSAVNQALLPVFKWRKQSVADGYHLQISGNAAFTGTLVADEDGLVDTTFTPTTALANATTYYWRVYAKNAGGTGPASAASFTTLPAVPAVPEVIGPADNVTQQPLPVVCTWHKAARAASYRVQISLATTFATRVLDTLLTDPDTVLSLAHLNYATDYFWRVRSENAGGNSAYAAIRDFTTLDVPAVPTLVDPAAAAVDLPITNTLVWHKSARAVTYRLELSTNVNFTGTLTVDSNLADTTLKVGPLKYLTDYYWRVSAKDAAGSSAFSTERKFTTVMLVVPPAPVLVSPADAATGIAPSPTLKWHPALRATDYRVQVSLTPTFGTIAFQDTSVTDTVKAVGPLQNDQVYYWRVTGKNASGAGAYSEIRSFTTKAGAAGEPVLVSPADSASKQPRTLSLVWKAARNAVTYRLQVSTHADFSSPFLDDSTEADTAVEVKSLVYGTAYYWRVRSQNADGNSAYSPARKFTVVVEAPAVPGLVSPGDTASNLDRSLTLKWNAVARAATYRVQISKTATFASVIIQDSALTDTSKALVDLEAGATFFWRVRSQNEGGASAYSEIRSFKTKPPVGLASAGIPGKAGFAWHSGFGKGQAAELEFNVPARGNVRFTLINPANGRSEELLDQKMEAGHYRRSVTAQGLGRGLSFLRMDAGVFSQTRKVFLP